MTVDENTMEELRALEKTEVEVKRELSGIKLEINRILIKFQRISIDSWDGAGSFEDGRHVVNAPEEKVRCIEKIESGYKGDFVIFKSGSPIKLEEYFTPDEVDSIRKT